MSCQYICFVLIAYKITKFIPYRATSLSLIGYYYNFFTSICSVLFCYYIASIAVRIMAALLGTTGIGKTTLFRLILNFIKPADGIVTFYTAPTPPSTTF